MTRTLEISLAAQGDIRRILHTSALEFGNDARGRYAVLIATGLEDLRLDPMCPGSMTRSDLLAGTRTYHLVQCRRRAGRGGKSVKSPRHLIVYATPDPNQVVVLRVLHDAMELSGHLGNTE